MPAIFLPSVLSVFALCNCMCMMRGGTCPAVTSWWKCHCVASSFHNAFLLSCDICWLKVSTAFGTCSPSASDKVTEAPVFPSSWDICVRAKAQFSCLPAEVPTVFLVGLSSFGLRGLSTPVLAFHLAEGVLCRQSGLSENQGMYVISFCFSTT